MSDNSPLTSEATTLLIAVAGTALTMLLKPDVAALAGLGNVVILCVLLVTARERSYLQTLAYAVVCGYVAAGASVALPFQLRLDATAGISPLVIVWAIGTAVFFLVDRLRQGSVAPASSPRRGGLGLEAPVVLGYTSRPVQTAPVPMQTTPVRVVEETPLPARPPSPPVESSIYVPPPAPVVTPPPAAPPTVVPEVATPPPAPAPVMQPASIAVPAPQPSPAPPITNQPHLVRGGTPEQTSSAAAPSAAPPIDPRNLTDIYVNLLGEGMPMLRSVKASHVRRDFYQIVDTMPTNERWEFQPGQIVRCQKRGLSSGRALVAIEEAPRAQ